MQIDASFSGGNVQINSVDGNHIYFGPDHRDSKLGWFYWCFRVRGQAGQTLHFHPSRKNLLTAHAPAISSDGGANWSWADPASVQEDDSFSLAVPQNADDFRVCLTIPYTQVELNAFSKKHHGRWDVQTLCVTPAGSEVPMWHVGPDPQNATHRLFITARHHCCESMANYLLEGLIAAALSDDEVGQWWQKYVSLTAVPFVDWDGVAAGDQGKNRHPRDHNRDYDDQPIYPQTPAIKREVTRLASYGLAATLDLHCPWVHGKCSEEIYFVGQNAPRHWAMQEALATHLAAAATGEIPYDPQDNLPFGQAWNVATNFSAGQSFSGWTASLPEGILMSSSIEIPYALARGHVMTASNVRTFGGQMATALRAFMIAEDSR